MRRYIIYNPLTGELIKAFSTLSGADLLLNTPVGMRSIESAADLAGNYIDTSNPDAHEAIQRPIIADLSTGYAPLNLDLSKVPAQSTIKVVNEFGDMSISHNPKDGFILTDPGRYRLQIDAPFPFLPLAQEIQVK